jgi:hypothetical protein
MLRMNTVAPPTVTVIGPAIHGVAKMHAYRFQHPRQGVCLDPNQQRLVALPQEASRGADARHRVALANQGVAHELAILLLHDREHETHRSGQGARTIRQALPPGRLVRHAVGAP